MIILVTGGRAYNDAAQIARTLDAVHKAHYIQVLVHGCATGADTLAAVWAMERGIQPAGCPALWDFYGPKTAGGVRNHAMLWLKPELLVAFPGGSGTANMVGQARQAGLKVVFSDHSDLVGA